MIKNLVIVCDSAFGLDAKKIAIMEHEFWKKTYNCEIYSIKGFIGTETVDEPLQKILSPYLGMIDSYSPQSDDYFIMAIVDPARKKAEVENLKARGAVFETLWAPWVMAHLDFDFPEGCIIAAQSIMDSAKIGKFVTLFHSMVGFDAVVEDYSSVMAYSNITSAHIGNCVWIKDNCAVLGDRIGDNTVVMPNSIVVKKVAPNSVVSGNPAKRMKLEE